MGTTPIARKSDVAPLERNTQQRRAIREVFEHADRPLAPEDVVGAARLLGARVSLATVYRSIRALTDDGWLASVEVPGSAALYEIADKEHHHHFVCLRCKRVFELEGCVSIDDVALPHGFRALSHDLTISGTCADCSGARI